MSKIPKISWGACPQTPPSRCTLCPHCAHALAGPLKFSLLQAWVRLLAFYFSLIHLLHIIKHALMVTLLYTHIHTTLIQHTCTCTHTHMHTHKHNCLHMYTHPNIFSLSWWLHGYFNDPGSLHQSASKTVLQYINHQWFIYRIKWNLYCQVDTCTSFSNNYFSRPHYCWSISNNCADYRQWPQ